MADPYSVLGVAEDRLGRRHPQGVPQARQEAPSRPQSRRQGGRGQVQGNLAGQRHPVRSREAPPLRRRRDRRAPARRCRRAASIATRPAASAAPSTSASAAQESFVDMGDIFSEMFGQRGGGRGRGGFSFRAGDGEGFDMGGMPVTYSLRVPFLVARARRQAARQPAGRQDARHRHPRGHDRRPDPAAEGAGHARRQGPSGGRRLCRDPCRSAPLLRAARQRHPCRVAGDARPRRCWAAGSACRPWAGRSC